MTILIRLSYLAMNALRYLPSHRLTLENCGGISDNIDLITSVQSPKLPVTNKHNILI